MSAQVQQASILSGRQLVLAVTIALHAAAISALMAWRIAEVMQQPLPPIELTDPIPNPDPPPARSRDASNPQVIRPLPQPQLADPKGLPVDEDVNVVTTRIADDVVPPATGGSSVGPEQTRVPADTALTYRATRSSNDYYPAQAIRLEQEGVAIVRVCTNASGAQSALPQVIQSSRSRLLDGAAATWAREALQFTPATHAGVAVPACKEFRVNFTLH